MLEVKNITSGYGSDSSAIHDISLSVEKGKLTTVVGSNGAGKTTLLKTIMGQLKVHNGSISIGGEESTKLLPYQISAKGVAYVPQGRMIFPYLSVEENLLLGAEVKKLDTKKAKELGYSFFPDLENISKRKGGMLSGGQQQQLAIARMLVLEPEYILLDEPAEGVQPNVVQNIGRILQQAASEMNVGVLLVEQFVAFALGLAQQYYFLQGGQVKSFGEITEENRKEVIESVKL